MWNFLKCWTHRELWLLNWFSYWKYSTQLQIVSSTQLLPKPFWRSSLGNQPSFHLLLDPLWWCFWGQLLFWNTFHPFVRLARMYPLLCLLLKTCISCGSISKSTCEQGLCGLQHSTATEKESLHRGICDLTPNQQSNPKPNPNNLVYNISDTKT